MTPELTPERFTFPGFPARVVFGRGSRAAVARELAGFGARRVLLTTTPGRRRIADAIAASLGDRVVDVFEVDTGQVLMELAVVARTRAQHVAADACVAIGGGAAIGLAKAIALAVRMPIAAVPTTFSGSEMTPIWGLTERGVKTTGRDPAVAPRLVIYDPELYDELPAALAGTSGLNALAHCVEATYAPDGNPAVAALAVEGARRLAAALPALAAPGRSAGAVDRAVSGAWLAGCCLGAAAVGLHHKLCHTLGGSFDLPHAAAHAVILPHAIAYNRAAAAAALAPLAAAVDGSQDLARAVYGLARRLGAPRSLAELGMPADGLERAADLAVAAPYPNPRPLERAAILQLLRDAHAGAPPR